MITVFLPPFPFRGVKAPYLWFFYKFLDSTEEKINFLVSEAYLTPPTEFKEERWELSADTCTLLNYKVPSEHKLQQHNYFHFEDSLFSELLDLAGNNPIKAFKQYMTERLPPLETALEKIFDSTLLLQSEVIITCVNCPSLTATARARGIPVVHIELGPLRAPHYRWTAYFDFSGVNGNSEAHSRFLNVKGNLGGEFIPTQQLRSFFVKDAQSVLGVGNKTGIPLQVEDDSNLVAYGNDYDNSSLISYVTCRENETLVRAHPNSAFTLKKRDFDIDLSPSSLSFLSQCSSIITINSSVGLEALLFDRKVQLLGESSYAFLASETSATDHQQALAFYLFSYLIPFESAFNADYIRFRLSAPNETKILHRNLQDHQYFVEMQDSMKPMMMEAIYRHMQLKAEADNRDLNSRLCLLERQLVEQATEKTLLERTLYEKNKLNEGQAGKIKALEKAARESAKINNKKIYENDKIIRSFYVSNEAHLDTIKQLAHANTRIAAENALILSSTSWRITAPLRAIKTTISRHLNNQRGNFMRLRYLAGTVLRNPKLLAKAFSYFQKNGLLATIAHSTRAADSNIGTSSVPILLDRSSTTFILTTPHCIHIGNLIKHHLQKNGFAAKIIFDEPQEGFNSSLHFVICPQMFFKLPGLYVAVQMEQSVSSRWFNEQYIRTLENSFAIFDYSTRNIQFLQERGLSHRQIYYMPIDYIAENASKDSLNKEYDVIFYGDIQNPRRKSFLEAIQERFETKVINDVFGEELHYELSKAKVVVNIHYYEGALLESTRIYECLSNNLLVISEKSSDMDEHDKLSDLVDFVDVGDINAMLERIDHWVHHDDLRAQRLKSNKITLSRAPNHFEYFFNRFLLATDNIDFDTFYRTAGHNITFDSKYVCLGLPESTDRKKDFEKDNAYGFQYFPGLRHSIGWIGCGLSYKFIMRKAAEQKLANITVCEDDVEFLPGWKERFDQLHQHLEDNDISWDIFSGLIANLHADTKIKNIDRLNGFDLIHIDKMISAVLNTYNSSIFTLFSRWDERNRDPYNNTIDKYIESQSDVDVVTTSPFLVGHKEELTSTLWGFKNTQYKDMIAASVESLNNKAKNYKAEHSYTSNK